MKLNAQSLKITVTHVWKSTSANAATKQHKLKHIKKTNQNNIHQHIFCKTNLKVKLTMCLGGRGRRRLPWSMWKALLRLSCCLQVSRRCACGPRWQGISNQLSDTTLDESTVKHVRNSASSLHKKRETKARNEKQKHRQAVETPSEHDKNTFR